MSGTTPKSPGAATIKTGFDAKDLELMLAALCHDLGREPTTKYIHNRWRSLAEHESGFIRTESFLRKDNGRIEVDPKYSTSGERSLPSATAIQRSGTNPEF